MDKLAIVMGNYIDVECDANTTPRQAYERGFRRATKKCETVMHSRKIEKEKTLIENDRLMAENAKLRELLLEAYEAATEPDCGVCYHVETCNEMPYCIKWVELEHRMRDELGIEVSK